MVSKRQKGPEGRVPHPSRKGQRIWTRRVQVLGPPGAAQRGQQGRRAQSQGAGKTRATTARWPEEGTLGSGSLGTLGLEKEPFPTPTPLGRALHQETSRCPPGPPGKQPHVSVR